MFVGFEFITRVVESGDVCFLVLISNDIQWLCNIDSNDQLMTYPRPLNGCDFW